jgi:hypothetical protein
MISSAGHYDDGAELKTLSEVHGANGHVTACGLDVFIENLE